MGQVGWISREFGQSLVIYDDIVVTTVLRDCKHSEEPNFPKQEHTFLV